MKKSKLFLGAFVLALVFLSFVSSCDSSQVIFSLYSETNSHIGSPENSDYPVKACYNSFFTDEEGNRGDSCEDKNIIFYKYSNENSHVSLTQINGYNIPVCYGDLVCQNRTTGCIEEEGEVAIARISSETNAHISLGDSNLNFPILICCKRGSQNSISSISVDSAKWIDSSSGNPVSQVSNGTKVNLSFQGTFEAGERFNYTIYYKVLPNLGNLFSNEKELYSGSSVALADNSFSSISFDAVYDINYVVGKETVYLFEIFGKDGNSLNKSGELKVDSLTANSPTKTRITSPKDGEIYLVGDSINLSWAVVSGNLPVQNITYYSSGANINGTGRYSFSVAGNPNDLLSLPLFLNYSTSGQKEITLTTIDSMGNPSVSRVLISVPQQGVNVFAFINKPKEGENIIVNGEPFAQMHHNILFNSSGSYVYNYSDSSILCLAGICPPNTSGDFPKSINPNGLNNDKKNLKDENLFFNWTWKDSADSVFGNGTKPGVVSFLRIVPFANNQKVSLKLNYFEVSSSVQNNYSLSMGNGFLCKDDANEWYEYSNSILSPTDFVYDEDLGCCCKNSLDYTCDEDDEGGYFCNILTQDLDEEEINSCSDFKDEESCLGDPHLNSILVDRANGGKCLTPYSKDGKQCVYSLCECVWKDDECFSRTSESCLSSSGDNEEVCGDFGMCLTSTTTTGSCLENSAIEFTSSSSWSAMVGTDQEDSVAVGCKSDCDNSDETSTIPCPVRLKLSFFGVIEFVVTIILIALIYFVIRELFFRKKVSEEKKKEDSVKKVSRKKKTKKKKN